MTEFPIGHTLDRGTWKITECLAGEAARGYFRARDKARRAAIVSLAHYQKGPIDVAHYAMTAPRITPCLYAGRSAAGPARCGRTTRRPGSGSPARR